MDTSIGAPPPRGSPSQQLAAASHVPAGTTKALFPPGVYLGRDHFVRFLLRWAAGRRGKGSKYVEPGNYRLPMPGYATPDAALPPDLTLEEEREAAAP